MPVGRLITLADLRDLADRGLAGERVYLKGQFVVNFTEPNRAVLRPKTGLTDAATTTTLERPMKGNRTSSVLGAGNGLVSILLILPL